MALCINDVGRPIPLPQNMARRYKTLVIKHRCKQSCSTYCYGNSHGIRIYFKGTYITSAWTQKVSFKWSWSFRSFLLSSQKFTVPSYCILCRQCHFNSVVHIANGTLDCKLEVWDKLVWINVASVNIFNARLVLSWISSGNLLI